MAGLGRVSITKSLLTWSPADQSGARRTAHIRLNVHAFTPFALKRRPDTLAVLLDHRLVFAIPAPSHGRERLLFHGAPSGWRLARLRYRAISPHRFGDDFMRSDALERYLTAGEKWVDDPCWSVAWCHQARGDGPNPWQISLFPNSKTTANAFWMVYSGTGTSALLANPTLVFPSWDRYYVQAAAKTNAANGEIGLLAAYQDARNYLLFRWRQRESAPRSAPRAELIAVIDGVPTRLASCRRAADPEQWYTLRINLGWRKVQALVDGVVLLQADNPGPIEGRVGLYAGSDGVEPVVDAAVPLPADPAQAVVAQAVRDMGEAPSTLAFDDVKVGDWVDLETLNASHYPHTQTGRWLPRAGELHARVAGEQLIGSPAWSRYTLTAEVFIPQGGQAGLLMHRAAGNRGYAWWLSAHGQQLVLSRSNTAREVVEQTTAPAPSNRWATLRVEADGPYLALFLNERRVLEHYDPTITLGQCGVAAHSPGVAFRAIALTCTDPTGGTDPATPSFFTFDPWASTWASPEADWYPAVLPAVLQTPAGRSHVEIGAAAPLPTDVPGLYWYKGGLYGDCCVRMPLTPATIAGQRLYLSITRDTSTGYALRLDRTGAGALLTYLRRGTRVAQAPLPVLDHARLCLTRRGAYILITLQTLDPMYAGDDAAVLGERLLLVYRDPQPLPAVHLGVTVTSPRLAASRLSILSTGIRETFTRAPANWTRGGGVWNVMTRYACDDRWNWFGGFGLGTPVVWWKQRLDGDQTVEAYLGIKMFTNESLEAYFSRYRDLAVSLCANGRDPDSGYTLLRCTHVDGKPVTQLRRCGVVVWQSTTPAHLLPSDIKGHRQWFATRLEKHGALLDVYLDNRLATSFVDPHPLSGGYVGLWTRDNGMMLGRVNLFAQRMAP